MLLFYPVTSNESHLDERSHGRAAKTSSLFEAATSTFSALTESSNVLVISFSAVETWKMAEWDASLIPDPSSRIESKRWLSALFRATIIEALLWLKAHFLRASITVRSTKPTDHISSCWVTFSKKTSTGNNVYRKSHQFHHFTIVSVRFTLTACEPILFQQPSNDPRYFYILKLFLITFQRTTVIVYDGSWYHSLPSYAAIDNHLKICHNIRQTLVFLSSPKAINDCWKQSKDI